MTPSQAGILGNAVKAAARDARVAEYLQHRIDGLSIAEASGKVGVKERTGRRNYEPRISGPGVSRQLSAVAGRREDYVELRDLHGCTRAEAAKRLGVCTRTIQRYETALRAGGAR